MKTDKMKSKKKDKQQMSGFAVYNPPKIKFKFDKAILNMFIGYIYSEDKMISRLSLGNLYKLLDLTDSRPFEVDVDLYTRFEFAKKSLEGKIHKGITKSDLLKTYAHAMNNQIIDDIILKVDDYARISPSEIKFINNAVTDRLQYSFIVLYKEIIMNEFMRLDMGDYESYKEIVDSLKEKCGALMNEIRKADSQTSNITFSLRDEIFDAVVEDVVNEAIDPSAVLVTGLQTLNSMLSPGYIPGRLYMYLG